MQTISAVFAAWTAIEAQSPVDDDETLIRLADEKTGSKKPPFSCL